ncbi:hypothetical protein [Alistipes sp. ZOR0009]|uniref:hypothetical protein n=1 Tax=Alistipes sp. ZOR0009 TaxID=1339253 RepID=UPI000A4880F7|nr:hypothetical protein [Alistipes sp. ZOR0009]
MKKTRVLGVALTLAATMAVGGAMGQANTTTAGYVKTGATDAADATNQRSYITKGKKLGFFVEPDMAFHPNWTAAGTWKLTPDFSWIWSVYAADGTTPSSNIKFGAAVAGAPSYTGTAAKPAIANDPANFVEMTAVNSGVYTIKVAEKAAAAFGSCTGAAKTFSLVVMDEPEISIDADVAPAVATPTTGGTNNRTLLADGCGDLTNWNVNFSIKAADYFNAQIKLEEISVKIDAAGVPTEAATPRNTYTYDFRNQAVTATSAVATLSGTAPSVTGWNADWNVKADAAFSYLTTDANRNITLKHQRDFKVYVDGADATKSDIVTLFRYTVLGVNDFVSRKSDLVANNTTLGALYGASTVGTPKIIDIYVKRAPKTGPVYHINNNIAK